MYYSNLKSFENKLNSLTKDEILKNITQEDIFYKYLGIFPTIKNIKSPLRKDKNAGCGFYINNSNIIKYYDKSKSINEDCFGIVKLIHNIDFNKALLLIANDFGLLPSKSISVPYRDEILNKEQLIFQETKIKVQIRDFDNKDLEYWKQFNISKELLKIEKVFAIQKAWLSNNNLDKLIYKYNSFDLCYCYCFPENKTKKLYLPNRTKDKIRFYAESNLFTLSGYNNLSLVEDYVIITKSKKDELCLKSFGIKNVCSIQAESIVINKELITDLYNRFDNIFTLFDYDLAGIKCSKLNKSIYPFLKPLFIRDASKDFSGFIERYGISKGEELIDKFKEYIKQFIYE